MNPFQLGDSPARCLCTPHRRTLFGEGRGGYNQGSFVYLGYNQGSFVYLAEACGGWVFAGANGVG